MRLTATTRRASGSSSGGGSCTAVVLALILAGALVVGGAPSGCAFLDPPGDAAQANQQTRDDLAAVEGIAKAADEALTGLEQTMGDLQRDLETATANADIAGVDKASEALAAGQRAIETTQAFREGLLAGIRQVQERAVLPDGTLDAGELVGGVTTGASIALPQFAPFIYLGGTVAAAALTFWQRKRGEQIGAQLQAQQAQRLLLDAQGVMPALEKYRRSLSGNDLNRFNEIVGEAMGDDSKRFVAFVKGQRHDDALHRLSAGVATI